MLLKIELDSRTCAAPSAERPLRQHLWPACCAGAETVANVPSSLPRLSSHYGFNFTTGMPFKQGGNLAALLTQKRKAEMIESYIEAWLSKRRRISCVEMNSELSDTRGLMEIS